MLTSLISTCSHLLKDNIYGWDICKQTFIMYVEIKFLRLFWCTDVLQRGEFFLYFIIIIIALNRFRFFFLDGVGVVEKPEGRLALLHLAWKLHDIYSLTKGTSESLFLSHVIASSMPCEIFFFQLVPHTDVVVTMGKGESLYVCLCFSFSFLFFCFFLTIKAFKGALF